MRAVAGKKHPAKGHAIGKKSGHPPRTNVENLDREIRDAKRLSNQFSASFFVEIGCLIAGGIIFYVDLAAIGLVASDEGAAERLVAEVIESKPVSPQDCVEIGLEQHRHRIRDHSRAFHLHAAGVADRSAGAVGGDHIVGENGGFSSRRLVAQNRFDAVLSLGEARQRRRKSDIGAVLAGEAQQHGFDPVLARGAYLARRHASRIERRLGHERFDRRTGNGLRNDDRCIVCAGAACCEQRILQAVDDAQNLHAAPVQPMRFRQPRR